MNVDQDRVFDVLGNLDGSRPLRRLMERVLGYDFSGGLISTAGWPEDVVESLASEPELFATAGRESRFGVIRVKLASSDKLSLVGPETGSLSPGAKCKPLATP